ncbi:MAG: Bug family tripartite tricarboxylate transporter substrate binding protein [Hyphomicrobiaceae bacterium]
MGKFIGDWRRRLGAGLAGAAIVSGVPAPDPAAAQDEKFPAKTINMVTHAGPGGGTDITTRMMMVMGRTELGQELVVVSKTGGSGLAALQYAMSQPRDGYTVLTVTPTHIFQILQEKVALKIDDLVGIARATLDPQIIAVKADSPIKTVKDLIEASKAKPRGLKWGTTFVGGTDHVAIQNFTKAAGGILYDIVPFRGGGDMVTNLVGGNLDAAIVNYAEGETQFKTNLIRAVAVLNDKRLEALKDTPTAAEQGVDSVASTVRGFAVLRGVPEDRLAILEKGMVKAMQHSVYQAYLAQGGMSGTSVAGREEWSKTIRQIHDESRPALVDLGILKK